MTRHGNRPGLWLPLLAALPALLCALLASCADSPAEAAIASPTPPAAAPVYYRSRFSTLTSSVWRYRQPFQPHDLPPVPENNPWPEPQPHRDRPNRLALSADGARLYVTLPGVEQHPGREVAVVDVFSRQVMRRIEVGSRPYGPFLHPAGRFLVVTNELSNYASVIDTLTDRPCGIIPLDYYCQGVAFAADGRTMWVANRYLDQVLVVDLAVAETTLAGKVREVGGFDDAVFYGEADLPDLQRQRLRARGFTDAEIDDAARLGSGGLHSVLRARCGKCHGYGAGGYYCGSDAALSFLSAIEHAVGGRPEESALLRAVTPVSLGGYGDKRIGAEYHSGGVCFDQDDPNLARLRDWIEHAEGGPGIPVGNEGSHPKDLVLSPDGKHLFVGNTGTMDVSIIDLAAGREVGAIYVQNVAISLAMVEDPVEKRHQLVVLSMGTGFGAPKARDRDGGETWNRNHPAAQFAVLRDPKTTDPFPIGEQPVLGDYDAVDGTWNIKMRDIQNDLVAVDLSRLRIPAWRAGRPLDYLLRASRYESHQGWVRYTSDTAEATVGDIKGDIPPELQRVHGSFPESAVAVGDRLYVVMAGTFEVVEWRVDPHAADPSQRLTPLRAFETGLRPVGIAAGRPGTLSQGLLFVANQLGETVTILDTARGDSREILVGDLTRPALDTDAEKGELITRTSVFTTDGDTSCVHCHFQDMGDGRGWGAAETIGQDSFGHITPGGTLGIPQMKNIFAIQPYYFEGTHRLSEGQGADILEPAGSIDLRRPIWAGDFTGIRSHLPEGRKLMHEEIKERVTVEKLGDEWYDLEERRQAFFRQQSLKYFGEAHSVADFYRFGAAALGAANRLLPNPIDPMNPSVLRGEVLFHDSRVMCGVCHTAPEFTNKTELLAPNERRALPPLTTITRRDASYTLAGVRAVEVANGIENFDLGPADRGRIETVEGSFTTMQLRGILFRPPTFLHHGRARSLREVLCTPGHPALRRYRLPVLLGPEEVRDNRREQGMNELTGRYPDGPLNPRDQIFDTHGGTSHLTPRQIDDLLNFLKSIE